MARMIPSVIDPSTRSPGEIELFHRFKTEPGTEDWTVLHSLNLPEHRTQIAGEIDFVILAPGRGVLCLEVKAHRTVSVGEDGRWRLGNDPPTSRSPFQQASDGMWSLIDMLEDRKKDVTKGCVFWSAVAFTRVPFTKKGDWADWEVFDQQALHSGPLAALCDSVFRHAREKLHAKEGAPQRSQLDTLTELLRPQFELAQAPRGRRAEREAELVRFTAEQFAALDEMEANPRIVFEGAAGTGKTFLAVEAARRAARSGHRVLMACYNHLLGDWLKNELLGEPGVEAGTLHSHMLRLGHLSAPGNATAGYWRDELPAEAALVLLDEDPGRFDVVIVDEAQDLLRSSYLEFIDIALRGGLAGGEWMMFGDFTHQALYRDADVPLDAFLGTRAFAARRRLTTNCRNVPEVADYIEVLGGVADPYSAVRRERAGANPELRFFKNDAEQLKLLEESLLSLHADGYGGDEIVVVSAGRECAAKRIAEPWRSRICPMAGRRPGQIARETIFAFKGMEAPAVIVTDVDVLDSPDMQPLLYVALSRATDRLIVLADKAARPAAQAALTRFFEAQAANA